PAAALLGAADLIVSFDWVELSGALAAGGAKGRVVQVSMDHSVHNGWSMDHLALPPADLHIAAPPDAVVAGLAGRLTGPPAAFWGAPNPVPASLPAPDGTGALKGADLAQHLRVALEGRPVALAHVP